MRSLIFFAIIIGIDIFLKSIKDKKKIEDLRRKRIQELQNKKNIKTYKDYGTMKVEPQRKIDVVEEIKASSFYQEGRSYKEEYEGYRERYQKRYDDIKSSYDDIAYDSISLDDSSKRLYDKNPIEKIEEKKYDKIDRQEPITLNLKKNIINGLIFSEVLGKPKSLQKR